jgi:FAD/FMN-containing dehydrogenase
VWNALVPERHPTEIAAPSTRDEVAGLVAAAGRSVAVKSGGHNWLGASLRDDTLLLDLGELRHVEVDVAGRTALVEPGATHQELADALVPHGLAFPIGHCPSVGLGGYLLAGGFGWNPRTWGPACWSVTALDVVGADGELFRVSADSHPDLFWAARGGGPGFPGIVTRFELSLYDLPAIVGRRVAYRAEALPGLMEWTAAAMAALPPGIEMSLIVRRPWAGKDRELRATVAATAFRPTAAEAEELLATALGSRPERSLLGDSAPEEIALNELEGEGGWTEGLRYWADSCWLSDELGKVGSAIEGAMRAAPSPLSRCVITFAGSTMAGPEVALARHGANSVNFYATWDDPVGDEANVAWVRESTASVAPWTLGHYIGECDLTAEAGRAERCFTPEAWTRLQELAAERDPERQLCGFLS